MNKSYRVFELVTVCGEEFEQPDKPLSYRKRTYHLVPGLDNVLIEVIDSIWSELESAEQITRPPKMK